MFANPCKSCINYISSVISAIVIAEIYSVTPLACCRLRGGSERDSRIPKIEKMGGNWGGFPFLPVKRSYFRVSFTYASLLLRYERLELRIKTPGCALLPPGFLLELFVSVSLFLFVLHLRCLVVHLSFLSVK